MKLKKEKLLNKIKSSSFILYKNHPIKNYKDEDKFKKKCLNYEKKFKEIIIKNLKKKNKTGHFYDYLLGPWLNLFVESVFLKYLIINKEKEIIFNEFNLFFPGIKTSEKFGRLIQENENFNNHLIRDIANYLKIEIKYKKKFYFEDEILDENKNLIFKLRNFFKNIVISFFNLFPSLSKKKKIILDGVFNFKDELIFIIRNKFLYKRSHFPKFKKDKIFFDLNFKHEEKNEFMILLVKLSKKYFPNKVKNILSHISEIDEFKKERKNKIFITDRLSSINEDYRIFVAQNNKNLDIFSVQHGGGYGQIKNFYLQKYEINNCKKFLSWGWKKNNFKIEPIALRKKNTSVNKLKTIKNILFVGSNFCLYEFRLNTVPIASKVLYRSDYIKNKLNLINFLSKNRKLTYKPHPANNWYKYFKLSKKNLIVVDKNKDITNLAKQNDLIILTHLSTSFMQMMSLNKPVLLYLEKGIYRFEDNFKKILDEMKKLNILFTNPKVMKNFLKKNKFNINYWYNPDTQHFIMKFLNSYYLSENNYKENFEKFIDKHN